MAYILVYISQKYVATLGTITQLCGNLCATKITSDYAELCGIMRRIIVTSLVAVGDKFHVNENIFCRAQITAEITNLNEKLLLPSII